MQSIEELQHFIPELAEAIGDHRLIVFKGEMGSGKTTLVKALCKCWGVVDEVTSPTFSIVQIYGTKAGTTINHIDLYRLKSLEEALATGIEEYLQITEGRTLIEWPDIVEPILPNSYGILEISHVDANSRKIVFLETLT
ncbi:MAG: tRNA (adenosine(37)-N6)-threonylcarbamoyltransferase complex ATPase subunit type 1 TsaE [Saprospiraceae bacterium]|nr:tRNA (adenosine(37)-N6)-threonylcarbamoyltransferase complex ATPase subunit type 1 TsaE [Saprospiraceae bacterium]